MQLETSQRYVFLFLIISVSILWAYFSWIFFKNVSIHSSCIFLLESLNVTAINSFPFWSYLKSPKILFIKTTWKYSFLYFRLHSLSWALNSIPKYLEFYSMNILARNVYTISKPSSMNQPAHNYSNHFQQFVLLPT